MEKILKTFLRGLIFCLSRDLPLYGIKKVQNPTPLLPGWKKAGGAGSGNILRRIMMKQSVPAKHLEQLLPEHPF